MSFVNIPNYSWQAPVQFLVDLPPAGNIGDVRLVTALGTAYWFDGNSWIALTGGGGGSSNSFVIIQTDSGTYPVATTPTDTLTLTTAEPTVYSFVGNSGTDTVSLTIQTADGSHKGLLTAEDWTTFNDAASGVAGGTNLATPNTIAKRDGNASLQFSTINDNTDIISVDIQNRTLNNEAGNSVLDWHSSGPSSINAHADFVLDNGRVIGLYSPSTTVASTTGASAGTIPDGIYAYKVTATINGEETVPGIASFISLSDGSDTNSCTVVADYVVGASQYNFYRALNPDLVYGLVGTSSTTTFVDDGSVSPGVEPPVTSIAESTRITNQNALFGRKVTGGEVDFSTTNNYFKMGDGNGFHIYVGDPSQYANIVSQYGSLVLSASSNYLRIDETGLMDLRSTLGQDMLFDNDGNIHFSASGSNYIKTDNDIRLVSQAALKNDSYRDLSADSTLNAGGTIPDDTTYYYVVSAYVNGQLSLQSSETSQTTSTGFNTIEVTVSNPQIGAAQYYFYRTTISGDYTDPNSLIGINSTPDFIDDGSASPSSGVPPSTSAVTSTWISNGFNALEGNLNLAGNLYISGYIADSPNDSPAFYIPQRQLVNSDGIPTVEWNTGIYRFQNGSPALDTSDNTKGILSSSITADSSSAIRTKYGGTPTANLGPQSSGGSLVDGTTYYWVVTAEIYGNLEETIASNEVSFTMADPDLTQQIIGIYVPGAYRYNLYRGTSPGIYDGVYYSLTPTFGDNAIFTDDGTASVIEARQPPTNSVAPYNSMYNNGILSMGDITFFGNLRMGGPYSQITDKNGSGFIDVQNRILKSQIGSIAVVFDQTQRYLGNLGGAASLIFGSPGYNGSSFPQGIFKDSDYTQVADTENRILKDGSGSTSMDWSDRVKLPYLDGGGNVLYIDGDQIVQEAATTNTQLNYLSGISGIETELEDFYTDAGNTSTTETSLYDYVAQGNRLANNGEKMCAEYGGTFVSSATATRRIRAYFGGFGGGASTLILDTGALTISAASTWNLKIFIIRSDSDKVRYVCNFTTQGVTQESYTSTGEVTGLTFGLPNRIKITGEASGTGAASDDIVAKLGYVSWKPQRAV